MTLITDPTTEATEPRTVIRFPNLSGAIVTVRTERAIRYGEPRLVFGARCAGCLDTFNDGAPVPNIKQPRAWAAAHSAACRALPQTTTPEGETR